MTFAWKHMSAPFLVLTVSSGCVTMRPTTPAAADPRALCNMDLLVLLLSEVLVMVAVVTDCWRSVSYHK
jgi:hypothetical protein